MKTTLVSLSLNAVLAGAAFAQQPIQTTAIPLFSRDSNYANYRIPTLVTTNNGTLIAMVEGRTGDDPGYGGDTDLVMRRSFDNGLTWTPMEVIERPRTFGQKMSNPTSVVDVTTGRVWVLYNRWEGNTGTSDAQPGTHQNSAWARYSDDNGATWSNAIDITHATKDYNTWNTVSFGPGSGIQASNGRLIIPSARWQNGWNSYVVYSDDHGTTWNRGALGPTGNVSNENSIVELADGRILMDARPNIAEAAPRVVRTSANGGATWTTTTSGQHATSVHAGLERWTLADGNGEINRIIWSGPRADTRDDLVLRTSYDEGSTYQNEKLLFDGYSGYSDMSRLNNGMLGVLIETHDTRTITFTSVNQSFLELPAGLMVYEPFTYNDNTLRNKDGGHGFSGQWHATPSLSTATSVRIENSNLGSADYPFEQYGNRRALLDQNRRSMARELSEPLALGSGATYYVSLLIRQDELTQFGFGSDDDSSSAESLNISLQDASGNKLGFGVTGDERYYIDAFGQLVQTAPNAYTKTSSTGVPAFLIFKIITEANGLNQLMLAAFDSGQSVPQLESDMTWRLATGSSLAGWDLSRLGFEIGSYGLWLIDELRIGTDFGLVVSNHVQPVPEPGTIALLAGTIPLLLRRRRNSAH